MQSSELQRLAEEAENNQRRLEQWTMRKAQWAGCGFKIRFRLPIWRYRND